MRDLDPERNDDGPLRKPSQRGLNQKKRSRQIIKAYRNSRFKFDNQDIELDLVSQFNKIQKDEEMIQDDDENNWEVEVDPNGPLLTKDEPHWNASFENVHSSVLVVLQESNYSKRRVS